MDYNTGQELASTAGGIAAVAAPGSGATVTLWLSTDNSRLAMQTARVKRLIINVYSSHASAANGLQIDESNDGGPTNWRNVVSYTVAATTYTKNYVAVSAPYVRVRYVNSANLLTTWEYSVLTDEDERSVT